MYNYQLHQKIQTTIKALKLDITKKDNFFYSRFIANIAGIQNLYSQLYGQHQNSENLFEDLITMLTKSYAERSEALQQKDLKKCAIDNWFLSNNIAGMSLYVDRFCGNIKTLNNKLDYFTELGVNLLHLMPLFKSPEGESDGGYAVSNFREVDNRFGTLKDLQSLQHNMQQQDIYLMLDIVLNHTSHRHEWAEKAKAGDQFYQDFFYMFDDRYFPDEFDKTMPEVFPESSPGNFTFVPECNKWVMSVFHNYQWDLNFSNPAVFLAMLDTIFFYANLGVDIIRIDAPAFIWKEFGTSCQNLPKAHTILRLIKLCVQVATPGMAILGEAIVAPQAIMKYFGTDDYTAKECDLAYNFTHMALQWDALATADTRVMLAAQKDILQKPIGTSWITYTRCHDDIGLGYDDDMIRQATFNPFLHRQFLKNYYSGNYPNTKASGALFSFNPKTQDARISGSLASLCGLEKAIDNNNRLEIDESINKILLMQAHSLFLGGIPMLFYGDEVGYTNDYSYLKDSGKAYDNRWMHRPLIDWKKNDKIHEVGTIEERIFSATKNLINIRKSLSAIADYSNLEWLTPHNIHIAAYIRNQGEKRIFCLFNFSNKLAYLTWFAFKEKGNPPSKLYDHYSKKEFTVGNDNAYLVMPAYGFYIMEAK
jgi:amylosucrase